MEKLTIEQKAERYDEAIERAEKWRNAPNVDKIPTFANRVIDDIFPELAESEDERIRKGLIAIITDFESLSLQKNYSLSREDMLAWLEKQGEKPQGKSALEAINEEKVDNQNCVKPADTIESSAFKDKLLELFQKFRYIKECVPTNGDIIDYVDAHIQELIDTIQNKSWSEEDENMIEAALRFAHEYGRHGLWAWLKGLKDRVKPKTTWKPSDEQMDALEHFVRSIGESGYASPHDNNTKLVYSLLSDLKKLRG